MADCSYSRCIQQRRNIRRELQRWTKNMVYIVGLERIAEELMGRRKWKQYQDSMQRNYLQPLNNNIKKNEKYQKDQVLDEEFTKPTSLDQHQLPSNGEKHTTDITGEEPRDETLKEGDKTKGELEKRESDIEDEEKLKDWSPQSNCYFCVDGKLDEHNNHAGLSPRHSDSDSSDSRSDLEAPPPTLTPTANILNNLNNHRNMTALESVTSMAALAAVAALSGNHPAGGGVPTAPQHLQFYNPNLLQQNWFQLSNLARNFNSTAAATVTERIVDVEKAPAGSGEQPLDLSSKGGSGGGGVAANVDKIGANIRLPTLDSKHIYKAKPRMSAIAGRRTYTEDELQAALRDIQSGKLGTRRAAVIYGIPRSTLRNKVYKLALERERESHLNPGTPLKIEEDETMDDGQDLSGAEEEKEVEKALERPLLSMADILRFSNMDNTETLKKALLQNGKEAQELYAGVEHSALGPYIQNLILSGLIPDQKLIEGVSSLPEVMKRMMAEEQLLNEQLKIHNNGDSCSEKISRASPANSVIMRSNCSSIGGDRQIKSESDMEAEDSTANVILKIPSFKPTSSSSSKNGDAYTTGRMVSPPVTSESNSPPILPGTALSLKDVKDVIAKSISQKFQQSPEPLRHPIREMEFSRGGFTPPLSGISVIKTQQPDISRVYQHHQQPPSMQQKSQNSGSTTGGKGTRPKRGKYRNYDRDSLVEAVRAVQRGEMSVHRAGSYYGVPHSTLEYKVKERHLMRPRKRDPKPNPVDEKIASLKQNDLRIAAAAVDKLKSQVIKPPQKFPPTSPNGIKLPMYDPNMAPMGYNPPPFPFWPHPSFHHMPIDYARSTAASAPFPTSPEQFFASQMMQKLHEESSRTHAVTPANPGAIVGNNSPALAKSARQMAESLLDGAGTNGFLDGIIRSSLESGVPTSENKKEDKNVAPENMSNKALLDQLCRNSRLTPLTKPSATTENSSGDDESIRKSEGSEQGDIHTIELSNDSNDSSSRHLAEENDSEQLLPTTPATTAMPTGRIYLKHELTKPENLKPEMLVRYRDVLHDVDRNGIVAEESASESDVAQD